jgi:hypothetical protein
MSNYTIAVAWSGKDALSDSDAAKVISGADFNTEFTTVQTAVNTKADLNGSASEAFAANNLTAAGTLIITGATTLAAATATTPASGDNDTSVATTAYVQTEIGSLGTNGDGARTVSTSAPSGGSNGDIWYRY